MKRVLILLVLLLVSVKYLSAQELSKRWQFFVSSGAALPIGNYGKNNPADAAVYRPDFQNTWVLGFHKEKSGFAKPGYYYNAALQFEFDNRIMLFLRSGNLTNSVQTNELSDFLTEISGNSPIQVEHVDYDVFYVASGVGYRKKIDNLFLGLGIFGGHANSSYPYYKAILLFTNTNPPIFWAHDGERPNLNGFTMGGLLNIDYNIASRFIVGLELTYQQANFNYEMRTRSIPGGCCFGIVNDVLKVSVINAGLKVGYKFF